MLPEAIVNALPVAKRGSGNRSRGAQPEDVRAAGRFLARGLRVSAAQGGEGDDAGDDAERGAANNESHEPLR